MAVKLKELHIIALKLKEIGLKQTAGDIDYLISWLMSDGKDGDVHLRPYPAGKNTIDAHSHNCPIPYTPCEESVQPCKSRIYARTLLLESKDIISSLKSKYTDEDEIIAINEYIVNIDGVITILDKAELNEWSDIFGSLIDFDDIVWLGNINL